MPHWKDDYPHRLACGLNNKVQYVTDYLPKKNIAKLLILSFCILWLVSCRSIEKPNQNIPTHESGNNIHQQAVNKAYLWIKTHPVSLETEGTLPVLEEIMTFYVLWNNTEDASLKNTYYDEIQNRVNVIASLKDYQIQPIEYTAFLAVVLFSERLQIAPPALRKMIEEQIIPSPYFFSQNITNTIWCTAYLDRLNYNPPLELQGLMAQSNLQQEVLNKLLYQAISRPPEPASIDTINFTIYHITHEIFSLTNFGQYPPPAVIENNKAFYYDFFDKAIQWTIAINNVDLLGEIIMSVQMLQLRDVPSLPEGIEYILSRQEDNGSFGITNPARSNVYRHGIIIAMMALTL